MSGIFELGIGAIIISSGRYIYKKYKSKKQTNQVIEDDSEQKEEVIQEDIISKPNESNTEEIINYECRFCRTNILNRDVYWIYFIPYCSQDCYKKFLIERNIYI